MVAFPSFGIKGKQVLFRARIAYIDLRFALFLCYPCLLEIIECSLYLLSGSLPMVVSGFAMFSRMDVSACMFFMR